ncbi:MULTISPECIES: hypothetical protein [Streptomyces]|uniref:hypothetical protein n=1 Tax=Streptomyces TaxID=1883 RepID=UPI002270E5C2|nr:MULTISPECIES: hypothetical protein [unclassified Streptomyces]MCY0921657.1 hypothetical protein [Streptomyces sp. H27-G5]MCY0943990.1 hypothetical protein [Streptomyces sp. H34-AA3]MCY0956290.1 hypothetical protein [Streptomyces sp. H27-H5]MCZ4082310.1 hypothetical protein [Streptomyces sp. H34-S5]
MGLTVWPAPEDKGVVGPTGATGPQGSKGDTGAPGSKTYSGTAVPASGLGADGDTYVQSDTRTFLGVTTTGVTYWAKAAGAWAKSAGDVRGAAWYLNTTSTPSTDTRPGDMLLRTDTGDLWQRGESGWGNAIGNLRGPKGDPGGVISVNGKTGAALTLSAADLGAVPATGPAVITLPAGSSEMPLAVKAVDKTTTLMEIRSTGSVRFATGNVYADKNVRIGDAFADTGGGVGVLALRDAATVPTTATTTSPGVIVYSEGGILKIRQGDGAVITPGATPAASALGWGPEDHGLLAWAFDPALANSTGLYPGSGPIRVTAVPLRQSAQVSRIVWHATGYAGGLTSGSWAAIFNGAGDRVATTGDLSAAPYEPAEVHTGGGAAISSPLTSATTLTAGTYYVAWRMQYNATTGDGPMLLASESSAGSPPNFFGPGGLRRFGYYASGAATAPASINVSSMLNGANRFWVGLS